MLVTVYLLQVALSCGAELLEDQQTRFNCSIGNPLSKLSLINVTVRLEILGELVGNEGSILINFTVSSLNRELPFNIEDGSNDAMVNLTVEARADVTIDNGYRIRLLCMKHELKLICTTRVEL